MAFSNTGIRYDLIAVDRASRTLHQIGRAAGRTDSVMGKLGRTAKIAGEAMAGGLAVGLAVSAKHAAEFQSSMTKISTQAGATMKDVRQLSDQVLKLGTHAQQGPKELADSLYHLKSVGMDNVSAMKALKEASDLAAVGGSSLEETTNALAGAWRTGIKGAGSFHEAVSTVNAIIGAGNMRMEQFTEAIGTGILPSAKTFGLSLKQVGAALALMTDEGIPAVDAATRLRMSFSLLGAPSGAAEKQLKKIGITGLDLANAMRSKDGLIGAIQLLKDHLDKSGMSAAEQSQTLSRAFGGGRSSSAILTLINNLDVLKKKQDQVNKTTGRFDDAVKQQRKTAEAQWKLLTSNLEVMSVRVGTKVLPPITDFVQFLSETAMPAAAHFGKAVGKLIPVDGIKKKFGEAKGFVTDFFAGLSGNGVKNVALPKVDKAPMMMPKSQVAGIGQQIHDAITGGIGNIDWGKLAGKIGGGLAKGIEGAADLAVKLTVGFGKLLGKIDWVGLGIQLGKVAVPLLGGLAIGLLNFDIVGLLKGLGKHWQDALMAVLFVAFLPAKWAGAIGKFLTRIPFVGKLLAWGFEAFTKFSKGIVGWVGKALSFMGKAFMTGLRRVFPEIGEALARELALLPTRLGVWAIELKDWGVRSIRSLGSGIAKGGEWVFTKVGEFVGKLLKPFARAGGWLLERGKAVVGGLFRGIRDGSKAAGSWMWRTVGRPIVNAFRGAGSWLWSRGKALVSGLKNGIVAGVKGISSWTYRTIIQPQLKIFADAGKWLWSKGKSVVGGLKNGVVNGASGIGSWTKGHVIDPVVSRFSKAGSWLWSKGKQLISGMKNGIVSGIKGIGGWIKSHLVDPVVGWVKQHFGINSPSKVFMGIGRSLTKGLVMGMAKTHPRAIVKKVFGGLPSALAAFIKKGLISAKNLPGKALKALGGLGSDILGLLGLGGSGGGSSKNQQLGQVLAAARGWSGPQWAALRNLWMGESNWSETALNKSSGAYGIPQALPASKMASAGSDWKTSAGTQIKWGLSYIASRYGNPINAYSAWLSRSPHWYAQGTGGAARGLAWVGEKGPELVNFKGGEDVLSNPQSMAFAKANGIKLPGYVSGTISNAADRVRRDRQKVEDAKDAVANAKRRHKGVAAAEKRLKAAEKELQAAEIALRNARRSAKTSISNTLATGFLKKLETGTSSAIASAIKSVATKLLNAGYGKTAASIQRKGSKLESLADKRASIQKRIAEANQYASDQAGTIRDFLSISGTSATSVGDLIGQMGSQQKTASSFVALTKSLKARGASKELLQQLSDAGPGSQLATILSAKNVTTTDIAKLNKLSKSGNKLATSFGKDMADLMYDSGKNAGKGFLAGLKAQEKALQKQMNKLATDLVKAIKKALKIKSPSGVFRDEIGKNVVLGMAHGIDMHGHLVGAATQRLADTATGVSMRRRYVPTATSGRSGRDDTWERLAAALEQQASQPQQLTGQLVLDSGELLGVIQGTVKPMVKASEDRQAYRAKVGRRGG
ncbi:phage tail tape measure protein [Streptomyces sp. NPDC005209]|uniref:phage tail tape measure protein n=1 Tax=Streptomyces sp. NPDC005209 TaxID=3156715 RepID=UPI0033BED30C